MVYYLFTLFEMTKHDAPMPPLAEILSLGTYGYNADRQAWAVVIPAPNYQIKDKNGNMYMVNRKWQPMETDRVPPEYRTQILLLGE